MYYMVHYVICDYILNCVSVFVFTHNLVLLDYIVCTMSVLRIMLYLELVILYIVNIVSSADNEHD